MVDPASHADSRVTYRLSLTRGGRMLALMAVFVFMPAYAMSVSLMFLMGALLVGVLAYNLLSVVRCLHGVVPRPAHLGEWYAGREGEVRFLIDPGKRRFALHNLHLVLEGDNLRSVEHVVPLLRAGEPVSVVLRSVPQRRGGAALHRCRLTAAYPFGLVQVTRGFPLDFRVMVYPALLPASGTGLFADREIQGTVPRSTDDFVYLTTYRPGDDVRRIHWKKSVLLPQPVLRKDLAQVEVVVPRLFVPDPCPHFEYALSVLATHFAAEHHLTGWQVWTANGPVPARSREEMLHLLALAEPVEVDHASVAALGRETLFASRLQPPQ